MSGVLYIDGDFASNMGTCQFHCSPTCHPGQVDPKKWHYGCKHKAWPQNKMGDFVPFVECDGQPEKCELPSIFASRYKQGKTLSLKYAKAKVAKLEKELEIINNLIRK